MERWNEAGGGFYALDISQVYTPADVRDSYANAIQDCVENRNLTRFTSLLVTTSTSSLMRDEPFFTTQEILDIYTGGPSTDAPSDLSQLTPLSRQLENPDPALAPLVPYCGVFEGEGGRFVSDFYLSDGQVFWTAAPAEEGGELPFTVSEFGENVDLYTGPCQVKKNNTYFTGVDNVALSGSDGNGVQYAVDLMFLNNYIGTVISVKTPDSPSFDVFGETGFNKAA